MSHTTVDISDSIGRAFRGESDVLADPYPLYRRLLNLGGIHWLPAQADAGSWGDAWHVLGYDQCAAVLKSTALGAHRMPEHALGSPMDDLRGVLGSTLLYLDPPEHTRLRRVTAQTLAPRMGSAMQHRIRQLVEDLLDRVEQQRSFDVVADFATPLPNLVVAELLGIPAHERDAFIHHAGELMTLQPTPSAMANTLELMRLLEELVLSRRRALADDLVSDLLRLQTDAGSLTDDDVLAECRTVIIAGTETTTATITTAVLTVLQHPTVWEALTPSVIGDVVEEVLRYDGPTHLLPREAREPVQLGGHRIAAGQRLWLWLAAANRDPAQFCDPDEFVVSRRDARHLAFGGGIHACIGATLARAELRASLAGLRTRFPGLRLTDGEIVWMPNAAVRCPLRLHVQQ